MPGKVMNLILQISELLGRLSVRSYTETSKRSAVPDIEYILIASCILKLSV